MSPALVGVDWGTSSLRAARIDAAGRVLEERSAPRGILHVAPGTFAQELRDLCGDWLAGGSLCLVGGMAGSRQGWVEAPYCACPAGADDLVQHLQWVEPGRIAIVPGVSCESDGVPDVMRGEEVQVIGALALLGVQDLVAVLPGTHSKWVSVRAGRIASFRTYMTGEFYAQLRQHSIIARTMPADDGELDEAAFCAGVRHARAAANLLHAAFSARTLALFDQLPAAALPSYLSGLLIGEELRSQAQPAGSALAVIGAPHLAHRYALAADVAVQRLGSEATWRGLWRLAQSIPRTNAGGAAA
jgi:2-dehydro-3-deoxygalactonokinase